jgi:hypothetical protein
MNELDHVTQARLAALEQALCALTAALSKHHAIDKHDAAHIATILLNHQK